jgi:hypothetical protein
MNIVAHVPVGLVDYMWNDVKGLLQSAINKAHGEITLETVKSRLKEDSALLVCLLVDNKINSLVVLQIENFDSGKKSLTVCLAAGKFGFFDGHYDECLTGIAKSLGCEQVRAIGCRLGWERKLKNAGCKWQPLSTTLIYEV